MIFWGGREALYTGCVSMPLLCSKRYVIGEHNGSIVRVVNLETGQWISGQNHAEESRHNQQNSIIT